MAISARSDQPRTNRDPAELARKRALLNEPHVEPLTRLVKRIRRDRGNDRVPDFDPTEAGITAPILLLLEAPGGKATVERGGSGFVSPDNNDQSAANMWSLLHEAGIDRTKHVVTWNIIPWYIGTDSKIRAAKDDDLEASSAYTRELLDLLPNLRVVLLIGKPASKGWKRIGSDLPSIETKHPSPTNLNTRPHFRPLILDALVSAKQAAGL